MPTPFKTIISPSHRGGIYALARSFVLILAVFVFGTVGYTIAAGDEYTLLDAAYMTAITLTTVGYTEVIDLSNNPAGRWFTLALLAVGVGSFIYFFSNLTGFIVEGGLDRLFLERRMERLLKNLNDHFIVCGGGVTGEHILDELVKTGRPCVLVDQDEARADELYEEHGQAYPFVVGDATDDEVLIRAGIQRAQGLVACFSNDKDNLIIAFSARNLNANLRIVCRCVEDDVTRKIKAAGADAVISPNTIGGLRMVSELVRPTVVTFLDSMLRDGEHSFRVEEVTVTAGSRLVGCDLRSLRGEHIEDIFVLAIRRADDRWIFNPGGTTKLVSGDRVIFVGESHVRERFAEIASV